MTDFASEPDTTGYRRPPYRPPVGIPTQDGGRWRGVAISLAFHLFIVALIIVPLVTADVRFMRESRAAGAGPAGGGGGGRGGTGGDVEERVFYLQLSPGRAPAITAPPTRPPLVDATPPPQQVPVTPPPPRPTPTPTPVPPPAAPQTAVPASPADLDTAVASRGAPAPTQGTGGGTGNDGSAGSGSGRGGGVGSGVGTGRGSGVGPGTGGAGVDSIYPPTLLTLALPPLQPPAKVRPYVLTALFDVDERGNTRLIGFNQTSDSRFNRQMRSVLGEVKFRPATRRDGTAVRDTGRFVIEYP